MATCKRCGEAYDPESKSACAAGLCRGVELLHTRWMEGTYYVNGEPFPCRTAQMTWRDGKTYIAPYEPKPAPLPEPSLLCQGDQLRWDGTKWERLPPSRTDPDNLMRLLTSLERRLLDAECGYIELEQGLSVQEEEGRKLWEETRKLREHANSQWVQIDRLRDLAEPVARDEAEDKAACYCGDYEAMWKHYAFALDDAEEAAAEYHAAWQDAAVYWKDKVASLEQKLLALGYERTTAELNVDEAREAAAEYHAAWQDAQHAADYWQTRYEVRDRGFKPQAR